MVAHGVISLETKKWRMVKSESKGKPVKDQNSNRGLTTFPKTATHPVLSGGLTKHGHTQLP